jgi:hypothetical protein
MPTPEEIYAAGNYLDKLSKQSEQGNNPIQESFNALRDAALHGDEATRRQFIDNKPDGSLYYRKMSNAEWNAATNNGKTKYNFNKTFSFTNTNNYRLWVSTSLDKVRLFGNEDSTQSSDVIVMLVFNADLTSRFNIRGHQEKGIQNTPSVVAMHREGFPDIVQGSRNVKPNMGNDGDVQVVLQAHKAYNLGFTSAQMSALNAYLLESRRVDS